MCARRCRGLQPVSDGRVRVLSWPLLRWKCRNWVDDVTTRRGVSAQAPSLCASEDVVVGVATLGLCVHGPSRQAAHSLTPPAESHVKPASTSFTSFTHPHTRTTTLSTHVKPTSPWPSNPSPAYVKPLSACAPPAGPCDWKLTSAHADAPPNHCARSLRCHGCVTSL